MASNLNTIAGNVPVYTASETNSLVNGIDWKNAAYAGTVAALPSYAVSIDGQTLTGVTNGAIPTATLDNATGVVASSRLVIKGESGLNTPNNGIYVLTQVGDGSNPFILTRSSDANTPTLLEEATINVSNGDTLVNTQWHLDSASSPIVIGTTYLTWVQVGSGVYSAGAGLTLTGNVFSVQTSQITNSMLVNSSLTIGSTPISLGATQSTLVGLTSVTATTFIGALTGNASTATILQTARNINGVSFDGSANITITANTTNTLTIGTGLSGTSFNGSGAVTIAIDSTVATLTGTQTLTNKSIVATQLTGTLQAAQFPALTGEATTTAGSLAVTLTNSAVIGKVLTGYVSGAGTVAATDTILGAIQKLNGNIVALGTPITSVSGTANRITSTGGTTPVIDISASYVGQSSITTLGTITTGTWNGSLLTGTYGGTGVNNGSRTITIAGNLTTTGAFNTTLATGFTGTITLPTATSTLATLDLTETLTNKSLTSPTLTGTPITPTATTGTNTTQVASTAFVYNSSGLFYNQVIFKNILTPTAIAANTNDYSPTGLSTANFLRLSASGGNRNVTGLAAQEDGRAIIVTNVGASNNVVLVDSSASSTAANRFLINANATLQPNEGCVLIYDGTSSRWRIASRF